MSVLAAALIAALGFGCGAGTDASKADGVWWWDNRLDDSYLDFAAEHGVREIYYYTSSFTEKTETFLRKADEKDIAVYWLNGKYEWIEDSAPLLEKMQEYLAFQRESAYPFAGVHLDIEPHQHPEFDEKWEELILGLVALARTLDRTYPDVSFGYDIPFWLHDEISADGETKPAYAFMIDIADEVTLMSYRDDADAIYDVAKEEIGYAISAGKTLCLGVETGENEDDIVTFYEEGAAYLSDQLAALREMLPQDFGIVVHHIETWRSLRR